MTTQGRKPRVVDFFKQCCSNATRGREANFCAFSDGSVQGKFRRAITPTLSYDAGGPQVLLQLEAPTAAPLSSNQEKVVVA
jgi:hypothetical protein